jgi:hypothetical protein
MTFDEPRYVASSGNGMLVIRGPCKGKIDPSNTGAYCIRARDGKLQEIRVKGDYGVERIVALDDSRIAVVVPPRLGASGTLTLINPDGKAKSTRLKLPKEDASTIALLRKGLWLDGMLQRNKKELAGWVVASGPFVGVRIGFDGNVKVGKVESDIDRTLMSGQLALVLGRTGAAAESVDGGFEWREVNLPSAAVTGTMGGAEQGVERGCSRIGCVFGSWLRVGWRGNLHRRGFIGSGLFLRGFHRFCRGFGTGDHRRWRYTPLVPGRHCGAAGPDPAHRRKTAR